MSEAVQQAHHTAWQRLGEPGTWLTGAQRVAIAAETRRARECQLCQDRKAALSPFSVTGRHDSNGNDNDNDLNDLNDDMVDAAHRINSDLNDDMVDAAHRITTDPSRLTQDWLQALDISDAEYVEIVGVAITAIGIDTFDRAVGQPLRALPEALPGEPSRQRPSDATDTTAWVPMRKLAGMPNVVRALSLVPAESKALSVLTGTEYLPPPLLLDLSHDPGRAINRQQMELIAARVSAVQNCFY